MADAHGGQIRLEGLRAALVDLDGTVYHGARVIPGAAEAIAALRGAGLEVLFLTNNSASTRRAISEKLAGMGIECSAESVVTGGYAAGLLLERLGVSSAYVCGTPGLVEELASMGVGSSSAQDARCLVIGFDPLFDYQKLSEATRVALTAETIVACNRERTFRGEGGKLYPGCGAMVAAIEWCSQREANYIAGKPEGLLIENVCHEGGYEPSELLVIGDTYESDIAMAEQCGCQSILIGNEPMGRGATIASIAEIQELLTGSYAKGMQCEQ